MRILLSLRKHRRLFVVGFCPIVLFALIASKFSAPEPTYQGKSVSDWLEAIHGDDYLLAREAFREIGVGAIPFLFSAIKQNNGLGRRLYRTAWPELPVRLQKHMTPPAKLDRMLPRRVGSALSAIGSDAVPRLVAELRSFNADTRVASVTALSSLGTQAAPAVPALIKATTDPNGIVRVHAVIALGRIQPIEKPVISALLNCLRDSDKGPGPNGTVFVRASAAIILGSLGAEAALAIPDLARLCNATNGYTRVHATVALWRISQDSKLLSVMIKELEATLAISDFLGPYGQRIPTVPPTPSEMHNPSIQLTLLEALSEMGPIAKDAVPTILKVLEQSADSFRAKRFDIPERARVAISRIDPKYELPPIDY